MGTEFGTPDGEQYLGTGAVKPEIKWVQTPDSVANKRQLRIEALRAASLIVAGKVFNAPESAFFQAFSDTSIGAASDATLDIAGHFVKWLETGKR